MSTVTWNEIPVDLQQRVLSHGVAAVGDLASWAYANRPHWVRNDHIHDLLCALIVFLLRDHERPERRIKSLPAILSSIAYRQKCQRFRDEASERMAQLPDDIHEEDAPSPFAHLARLELRASIHAAMNVLNRREREAVLRKHCLGQSYREIAKALYGSDCGDKGEGRVSVLLTRARRKLRNRLAHDGTSR
jgi:RNA polymerase sigma factor (sigma-70 family)